MGKSKMWLVAGGGCVAKEVHPYPTWVMLRCVYLVKEMILEEVDMDGDVGEGGKPEGRQGLL